MFTPIWTKYRRKRKVGRQLKDFSEACKELIRSDSGPPLWFSPLECGYRTPDSPLLPLLPGSLTLVLAYSSRGGQDIFTGLESTLRSEYSRSPNRPIYLVGESHGGCLALAVTNRNPDIDLLLILSNPGKDYLS